jgi:hypothetical protein
LDSRRKLNIRYEKRDMRNEYSVGVESAVVLVNSYICSRGVEIALKY